MRYDAAHKARSRARILEAARARFRRFGFDGASIDQVMADAELTRGAFYAHFASKKALIREVLAIEAGLIHNLNQAADALEPHAATVAALRHYLDPAERDDVASGCPLVAHPVDAIRGESDLRRGYGERFDSLVAALAKTAPSNDDAVVAAVLSVGAALISAAVADDETADRIERVCLERIEALIRPN